MSKAKFSAFDWVTFLFFLIVSSPLLFAEEWFKQNHPLLLNTSAIICYGSLFMLCAKGAYLFGKYTLRPLKWTFAQYARTPFERLMLLFHDPKALYLTAVFTFLAIISIYSLIKVLMSTV